MKVWVQAVSGLGVEVATVQLHVMVLDQEGVGLCVLDIAPSQTVPLDKRQRSAVPGGDTFLLLVSAGISSRLRQTGRGEMHFFFMGNTEVDAAGWAGVAFWR